jgi:hypothetical protein
MNAQQNLQQVRPPQVGGKFFGVPLGDLGFATSLLMAFTVGFLSFFLFTFLAIVGLMISNGMGHHVDYAVSYKYISRPLVSCCSPALSFSGLFGCAARFPEARRPARVALVTIDVESAQRNGLADAQARAWCERLEAGDILYFPQTPIRLPAEDISFLLGQQQTGSTLHKNIAYKPNLDSVSGLDTGTTGAAELKQLQAVMRQ